MGVGIVGFGKIARDQHVGAIAESSRFYLHAVADPVADVIVEGATNVPHYRDVDSMLAAPEKPDAVAICTPPQARFDIARKALSRGVAVLLEKPPCMTVAEVETLRSLAQGSGSSLFCAWHSRFSAAVVPAREWLSSRNPRRVRIDWREDVRVWHPGQAWIWQNGGFGVFDPGINALSIATTILPGALSVREALLRVPANCQTPVSAALTLSDAHGLEIAADFDFLQTGPQTWEIEVETDQGRLNLLEGGGRLVLDGKEQRLGPNREYPDLYAHFARLADTHESDIDVEPLRLVEDALGLGRRRAVEPLHA